MCVRMTKPNQDEKGVTAISSYSSLLGFITSECSFINVDTGFFFSQNNRGAEEFLGGGYRPSPNIIQNAIHNVSSAEWNLANLTTPCSEEEEGT